MDVLLISKPGISLFRSLRESETAWDAIRFYGPVNLSFGVYIPVSTLAGAISLTSDLRYFLRKYTADYLFRLSPTVYCTPALMKSHYLNRDHDLSENWHYRLIFWIENMGRIFRYRKPDFDGEEILYSGNLLTGGSETGETSTDDGVYVESRDQNQISTGYLLEVWCTKPEYDLI